MVTEETRLERESPAAGFLMASGDATVTNFLQGWSVHRLPFLFAQINEYSRLRDSPTSPSEVPPPRVEKRESVVTERHLQA